MTIKSQTLIPNREFEMTALLFGKGRDRSQNGHVNYGYFVMIGEYLMKKLKTISGSHARFTEIRIVAFKYLRAINGDRFSILI